MARFSSGFEGLRDARKGLPDRDDWICRCDPHFGAGRALVEQWYKYTHERPPWIFRMPSDLDRSALVSEHEELAGWFARQYARRGLELDDAMQMARIAVWRASLAYDTERGGSDVTFSMFARRFLIRALQKALVKSRANGFVEVGEARPRREPLGDVPVEDRSDPTMENAVHIALSVLPEFSKAVLVRRYGLDGDPAWSISECSFKFGLPVGTLKKLLSAAREEVGDELRVAGWDPTRWCARGQWYERAAASQ